MSKKIKNLKKFLEGVSDKDIDVLSSDYRPKKLLKRQVALILEVSCFLLGSDIYTKKEISPFMSQANVWFILEKFRREGLVRVDDKGIAHKTRKGKQVDEYMVKHNLYG